MAQLFSREKEIRHSISSLSPLLSLSLGQFQAALLVLGLKSESEFLASHAVLLLVHQRK